MKRLQPVELSGQVINHFETDTRAEGMALVIDEVQCLNLRSRDLSCTACATACNSNALILSEDGVLLNDDSCTRCGACVPACPVGVLSLDSFSPRSFVEALAGKKEAHIYCNSSIVNSDDLSVPCHQILDARLLASAFAQGTEVFHLHGLAQCANCDQGNALAHVTAMRSQLAQWFGMQAPRLIMVDASLEDAKPPQLGRRDFLRLVGRQAVATSCSWLVADESGASATSAQSFSQREWGQKPDAYQSLLAEHAADLPWQDGVPWHSRSINDECNACMVCGQRCPTGALQAHVSETERSISFATALCTDCGLCAQVCPTDAIVRQSVNEIEDVMAPRALLMNRPHDTCRHCGQSFVVQAAEEDVCQACKNEQEMRQDWLAMMQ